MAVLGIKWEGEEVAKELAIWPENWAALRLFLGMQTQWRVAAGMSGMYWQGMDYTALQAVREAQGTAPDDWPDLFARLQVMELAAQKALNKAT